MAFVKKVRNFTTRLIESVFLSLSYLVGIGLASIALKLLGKKLVKASARKSNWQKFTDSGNLKVMY